MSRNPTALKIGMSGQLRGRRYTVRGWVVYGVEIDGETYYWTEFNVADANGLGATLVFEETEEGPTWKWFTLLEPRRPLSIAEAEAKQVGDTVEYEGRPIRITLVDESRAVEIEGEPPGHVVMGEVARYFNADAGMQRMFVATWVGGKIEFYIGQVIGRRLIEEAFGLPRMAALAASYSAGTGTEIDWQKAKAVLFGLMMIAALVIKTTEWEFTRDPVFTPPPALKTAPSAMLPLGIHGALKQEPREIAARARTEFHGRRQRFQVHEYLLRNAGGGEALLVQGWDGDPAKCLLLERVEPPLALSNYVAAGMRRTGTLAIGNTKFSVQALFLTRVQLVEGVAPERSPWAVRELYGFVARAGEEWLLCRWSEQQPECYVGRAIPQSDVLAAFAGTR